MDVIKTETEDLIEEPKQKKKKKKEKEWAMLLLLPEDALARTHGRPDSWAAAQPRCGKASGGGGL